MIIFCEFIAYAIKTGPNEGKQSGTWRDDFLDYTGILVRVESDEDDRFYFIPYEPGQQMRYLHTSPGAIRDQGDDKFSVETNHTSYLFRLADLPYADRSAILMGIRL